MGPGQVVDAPLERLQRAGIRPTRQRLRVLEELRREPHDVTAQELHSRLAASGLRVGVATIYRTLGLLAGAGVVDTLSHHAGEVCYRLCSESHHHHFVCSECHSVLEFEDCTVDSWLTEVARKQGFTPTGHHLEVVGVCASCTK